MQVKKMTWQVFNQVIFSWAPPAIVQEQAGQSDKEDESESDPGCKVSPKVCFCISPLCMLTVYLNFPDKATWHFCGECSEDHSHAVSFEINESHFPLLIRSWRISSGWDFQQKVFVNWTFVRPKKSMTFFSNPKMHPPTEVIQLIHQMLFPPYPDRPTTLEDSTLEAAEANSSNSW